MLKFILYKDKDSNWNFFFASTFVNWSFVNEPYFYGQKKDNSEQINTTKCHITLLKIKCLEIKIILK